MNQTPNTLSPWKRIMKGLLNLILTILCLGILAGVFLGILLAQPTPAENAKTSGGQLMDRFDRYMTNRLSDSLEGIASIEKVYWLDDHDIIAPEPDPNKFGTATDPKELAWLIEEAQPLLEGHWDLTPFPAETWKPLIHRVCQSVPVWQMQCNRDPEAAEVAYGHMCP